MAGPEDNTETGYAFELDLEKKRCWIKTNLAIQQSVPRNKYSTTKKLRLHVVITRSQYHDLLSRKFPCDYIIEKNVFTM